MYMSLMFPNSCRQSDSSGKCILKLLLKLREGNEGNLIETHHRINSTLTYKRIQLTKQSDDDDNPENNGNNYTDYCFNVIGRITLVINSIH